MKLLVPAPPPPSPPPVLGPALQLELCFCCLELSLQACTLCCPTPHCPAPRPPRLGPAPPRPGGSGASSKPAAAAPVAGGPRALGGMRSDRCIAQTAWACAARPALGATRLEERGAHPAMRQSLNRRNRSADSVILGASVPGRTSGPRCRRTECSGRPGHGSGAGLACWAVPCALTGAPGLVLLVSCVPQTPQHCYVCLTAPVGLHAGLGSSCVGRRRSRGGVCGQALAGLRACASTDAYAG